MYVQNHGAGNAGKGICAHAMNLEFAPPGGLREAARRAWQFCCTRRPIVAAHQRPRRAICAA